MKNIMDAILMKRPDIVKVNLSCNLLLVYSHNISLI